MCATKRKDRSVYRGEREEGAHRHDEKEDGGRAATQQESLSALLHQRLLIKISLAEAGGRR